MKQSTVQEYEEEYRPTVEVEYISRERVEYRPGVWSQIQVRSMKQSTVQEYGEQRTQE
jgi:hypothetical protein